MIPITKETMRLLTEAGGLDPIELLAAPPIAKLFAPDGAGTWLLSAVDPHDKDRAWGICDFGLGRPEIAWLSLAELGRLRGGLGMAVMVDEAFDPSASLAAYLEEAKRVGIVIA